LKAEARARQGIVRNWRVTGLAGMRLRPAWRRLAVEFEVAAPQIACQIAEVGEFLLT
jgi:hypothetical protein